MAALFLFGQTAALFAQSMPPLDVPRAGALPSATGTCDSVSAAPTLSGGAISPGTTGARSAGNNTASDLGAPLYSTPNAGTNVPLYSNPDAGDNVPLYTAPTEGSNAPLFSATTIRNNYGLQGGYVPALNSGALQCRNAIQAGEWLIYPSIRLYSIYSDNVFLSPSSPINAFSFGGTPAVTAQWTNGIHSTTIFANVDTQLYPTNNQLNTFDRKATFTQAYSPLPDLTFTALADYSHTTVTGALTNSIPTPVATPVTNPTVLPNGNIELPNGEIVSPTGQVVGNIRAPSGALGVSVVNPFDQYTTTGTITKIFNRGIVSVSGSLAQVDYANAQNPGTPSQFTSYTTKTVSENSAFWLGPLLYAYSNGVFSAHSNGEGINPNSQAYQYRGGLGTRQFGLFTASAYIGYQGSNSDTSPSAGGALYGGKISYFPSLAWTITAGIDETINKAPAGASSNLALAIASPEQIAVSSSTKIFHPSLQSQYQIAPQWTIVGNLNYTQIDYFGSPRVDHTWEGDLQLSYDIWRNMTLSWEYGYTAINSNAPGISTNRSLVMMSANYRY